jgi:hypothetical protein
MIPRVQWLADGDRTRSRRQPRYRQCSLAAACVALAVGGLPTSAFAAPIINYNLQPFGVFDQVNGDTLGLTTATLTNGSGTGTGAVRVNHGALGAYAEAIGQFGVLSTVVFQDTLTVTSSTLAAGTPVDLLLSLSLDYALSGTIGGASLDAFFGLGNSQSGQATTQLTAFSDLGVTVDRTTATFHTFVGATIGLTAQLHVGASAGNCCQTGQGLGDALNTMRFFVDTAGPMASAFSYTSETGAPYFTPPPTEPAPVPEPASLLIVVMGLAGAVAHRRSRRSR